MPHDFTLPPGAAGHGLVEELARAMRQLHQLRMEHSEALDLLQRARRCCEEWFEKPNDEPLYKAITKFMGDNDGQSH